MEAPFLLFLGNAPDISWAKTASGLAQWRAKDCLGQYKMENCGADLGLPDLNFVDAKNKGVKTLVIGIANDGGFIAPEWLPHIFAALNAGLNIAAGLHEKLADNLEIARLAQEKNLKLYDLRHPNMKFATGTGKKRSGKRLLTVGTDCAVGKKYTALSIEKALLERGVNATFCPTGQTGIMITGRGIAIDSVVADFISGAAEYLSPAADENHWHIIEGQGAILHPAYAGVTLGLVHGSQPDAIVICHEAGRKELVGYEGDYKCPSLKNALNAHLKAARLTNPNVKAAGVSLNTSLLDEKSAIEALIRATYETGLPACDPLRWDCNSIIDNLLKNF